MRNLCGRNEVREFTSELHVRTGCCKMLHIVIALLKFCEPWVKPLRGHPTGTKPLLYALGLFGAVLRTALSVLVQL